MTHHPTFDRDPEAANLTIVGRHVLHANIHVGPADVTELRRLSRYHADISRTLAYSAAHTDSTDDAAALRAHAEIEEWWEQVTELAADEIEAGRLELNRPDPEGYAWGTGMAAVAALAADSAFGDEGTEVTE